MVKVATALLLASFVAPARAANEGFFVAVDFGQAAYGNAPLMQPQSGFCPGGCNENFRPSYILSIGGGYHFNQNVGVEVSYTRINGSSNEWSYSAGGFLGGPVTTVNTNETLSGSSLSVAAVGTYAFENSFDVFAKLGLAHNTLTYAIDQTINSVSASASVTGSKTNLMYGVGVQYNYDQHLGVRLQYENLGEIQIGGAGEAYNSNVSVNVFSVGCAYNF